MKQIIALILALVCAGCASNDPNAPTEAASGSWSREKWSGHVYVIRKGSLGPNVSGYGSGIAHDPDCPCRKGAPKSD